MNAIALSFHDTQFDVIDRSGQPWLRGLQIASALGYSDPSSINRIFARNQDEFTDSMTASVKLTDPNGDLQETRIFSLRGCHLLAMFARTAVAKEFRKWVLDILEHHTQPRPGLVQLSEPPTINKAQIGVLFNRVTKISAGSGKIRAELWSRFQNHFSLASYKDLPAQYYDQAMAYLDDKEKEYLGGPVDMLYISSTELEAKVQERVKAIEGELLEKSEPLPSCDSITIVLKPLVNQRHRRWIVQQARDEMAMLLTLDEDDLFGQEHRVIEDLKERGYIVVKKTEVAAKLMA